MTAERRHLRCVVFAGGDVGYWCLKEIFAQRDEVLAVFVREGAPGENVWFRGVADLARAHGVPTFAPQDPNAPEWTAKIRGLAPEMIFSFDYGTPLGPEIRAAAPRGALDMHCSLLPELRGADPVAWALVLGLARTGATLQYAADELDAGDVADRQAVAIDFEETAFTLGRKIAAAAREIVERTLPKLRDGSAPRAPQAPGGESPRRRREAADGRIDWSRPAPAVYNLVRATTPPFPGAFTFADGRKLFVRAAHPVAGESGGAAPGTVVARDEQGLAATVATGEGLLRLETIQFAGEAERPGGALAVGAVLGEGA